MSYFDKMVNQINPTELQLNKAIFSYVEARFYVSPMAPFRSIDMYNDMVHSVS